MRCERKNAKLTILSPFPNCHESQPEKRGQKTQAKKKKKKKQETLSEKGRRKLTLTHPQSLVPIPTFPFFLFPLFEINPVTPLSSPPKNPRLPPSTPNGSAHSSAYIHTFTPQQFQMNSQRRRKKFKKKGDL